MFKKLRRAVASKRQHDERLYELALLELENGEVRNGLWGKALANCSGDEAKARSLYLKYRIQAMFDEATILEEIQENQVRTKAKPVSNQPINNTKSGSTVEKASKSKESANEPSKVEYVTEAWELYELHGYEVTKIGEYLSIYLRGQTKEFKTNKEFIEYCNEVCI